MGLWEGRGRGVGGVGRTGVREGEIFYCIICVDGGWAASGKSDV